MTNVIRELRELATEWLKNAAEPALKEASNEFLTKTYVDELNEKLDQLEATRLPGTLVRSTRTVALMPVPTAIYIWVRARFVEAEYTHVIDKEGDREFLDMNGIALTDDGTKEEFSKLAREVATMPTLYNFQERTKNWLGKVFDAKTRNSVEERALRLCEETIELAQALHVKPEQLHRLVDYVFARPVGDVGQEIAGSMVTLAAVACAAGCDLEGVAMAEVQRIEKPDVMEKIRSRQEEKRAALMTGV